MTTTTTPIERTQTDAKTGFGFHPESLTGVYGLTAALAAITGTVHLYLYATQGFLPFLFAGVVFFAAIAGLLVIPERHVGRRVLYALGVPFTAGQIGAWVMLGMPDFAIGVVDKVLQVALIVCLVYLFRKEM